MRLDKKPIALRSVNYPQWYTDVIEHADLINESSVPGSLILKPYSCGIWHHIRLVLDNLFLEKGIQETYFPLLIPLSLIEKEAEHIEGFAKECAIVTHHGLEYDSSGKLRPANPLQEPLIVRPTSETIINSTIKDWIESYRDLPLLLNQWANVVRWQKKSKPFISNTEFLWQEGHTAHANPDEAEEFTREILELYVNFFRDFLAIPVIVGQRSEFSKFAGADYTASLEAIMQDGKSLQLGTAHFLGQNFSIPFNLQYTTPRNKREYVWQTSWGVSTRLIGAIIMVHGDDTGLIIPPSIAPIQVVIVPVGFGDKQVAEDWENYLLMSNIRVKIDNRNIPVAEKYYEWERKGVPIRIEIGDVETRQNAFTLYNRFTCQKRTVAVRLLIDTVKETLKEIQKSLLQRANQKLVDNIFEISSWQDFIEQIKKGGFIKSYWCGKYDCENEVQNISGATIRSIPFSHLINGYYEEIHNIPGNCICCGETSKDQVYFARSY